MKTEFNSTALRWQLIITGTGFSETEVPLVYIKDVEQEFVSHNSTTVVVNMKTDKLNTDWFPMGDVKVDYPAPLGRPLQGFNKVQNLTITPKIVGMIPNTA